MSGAYPTRPDDPPYPPIGCSFEVEYTVGRRGHGVEVFPDEFEMGRWFLTLQDQEVFDAAVLEEDPTSLRVTDKASGNSLHVRCVTESERVPISYWHPRLVMGRIDGGSGRR